MTELAPLKFHPYLKSVLWGGDNICVYKGIDSTVNNIGESWEVSAVPDHESVVSEGDFAGRSLTEMINIFGESLLGKEVYEKYNGKFPLLVKFIDASENLSVQVHPDDELAAQRHNSMGKTEMWYIIKSEENAKIYSGLNRRLTPDEYVTHVNNKTFASVIAEHSSNPGDVFFIPAGRVHAIGAGNMLLEIQESSDVTYRIYDYDRKDADGNCRELHTELAKDAIDYELYSDYKYEAPGEDDKNCNIVSCNHFITNRLLLEGEMTFHNDGSSFMILICIDGEVDVEFGNGNIFMEKGSTILIPASLSCFELKGNATLISTKC